MKVSELIEKLKRFDSDALVVIQTDYAHGTYENVDDVFDVEIQEHFKMEIFPYKIPYFDTAHYEIKDREKINAVTIV